MKKIIVYVFFTGISLLVFGFIFRVHNEYAYKMARGSEEQWYFDERKVDVYRLYLKTTGRRRGGWKNTTRVSEHGILAW